MRQGVEEVAETTHVSDEKKLRDLSGVLEIAKAMSVEKDLRTLMGLIVRETVQMLDADRATLWLVDEDKREIWTWVVSKLEIKDIRLPFGQGIAGSVAETKTIENIPDAYEDARFDRSWDKKTGYRTHSILCAPLITPQDRIVGVIQVLNKKAGLFNDYDVALLTALGSHAAIALDNAFLVQQYLEKQKMQQAMDVARDIQHSLLPRENPRVPGFDIAGWCQTCDETGGDYYDFVDLGDGVLGIALGDVTGHGIGPALLMTAARAFLRATVTLGLDIQQVMMNMNDQLSRDVEDGRFMTLIYAVLNPGTRGLRYSSAGHDPMLVLRAGSDEFLLRESTGLPLGIMEDVEFPEGEPVRIDPGDLAVMATDGFPEAMNPDNDAFGPERTQQAILDSRDRNAADIIQYVHERCVAFCGEAPQRDDLTMVVIKGL